MSRKLLSSECYVDNHNECKTEGCDCDCHMPKRAPQSAEDRLRTAFPGAETEKAPDRGGQPVPVHIEGAPSMHDLLIEQIQARKELGLRRYGTILQAGNGRDALQDLLDELIDGCVYLMQKIAERGSG